jgi:hypothetical protein
MRRDQPPEPNFARLLTEQDLATLVISAHALRRFVQRLRPDIPGAEEVAAAMMPLEQIRGGKRTGREQVQLNRYRDWMTSHVEPQVRDIIRCEGFWTTVRPGWSRSDTPAAGYLQVGRMCGFPAANDDGQMILTTCTNASNVTWDTALDRGYTLVPKPYTHASPELLRPPSSLTIALRAWRSRPRFKELLAAYRAERGAANQETERENERRRAEIDAAQRRWQQQRDRAARTFRERHSAGGQ